MTAEVDVRAVQGARGRHDIDVLVQSRSGGMTVRWIIECKRWRRPVPKERVLALQAIVADVGADRGILVAESGFQAGAYRAAQNTSVVLTSLTDLRENTASERAAAELSGLAARSAHVSRRVRDLWPWATPLIASGPFCVKELLEVAGPSLEVQSLILPKLLVPSGPIVVADAGRFLSPDDARAATQELLTKTERGLDILEERLGSHYETVKDLVGQLRANAEAFLAVGSSLASESDGKRAVEAMRGLSDAADRLIATTPVEVTKAVRKVMRQFIDVVYLLPDQRASPDRWASESENVQQLIGRVDALLAVAVGKRSDHNAHSQD